jgi:hypothetical protein
VQASGSARYVGIGECSNDRVLWPNNMISHITDNPVKLYLCP